MNYICELCGYVYRSENGDPENGVAPRTDFEDVPEDMTESSSPTVSSTLLTYSSLSRAPVYISLSSSGDEILCIMQVVLIWELASTEPLVSAIL